MKKSVRGNARNPSMSKNGQFGGYQWRIVLNILYLAVFMCYASGNWRACAQCTAVVLSMTSGQLQRCRSRIPALMDTLTNDYIFLACNYARRRHAHTL